MASKAMMALKQSGSKALASVKKHSPEILLVTGTIAGIATVFTACRSTLKINDILDDHQNRMADLKNKFDPETKELKKATAGAYVKTATKFAKEFALPAACGAVAVGCNVGAFKIQKTRNIKLAEENKGLIAENTALAGAYAGIMNQVRRYREAVKEKVGEEVENELWNNLSEVEITKDYVDEKGKHKIEKKKKKVVGVEGASPYARYLTKLNPDFHKDPAVMDMYVRAQQAHMIDMKNSRNSGLLTLAEAYRVFNFEEKASDSLAGWSRDMKIHVKCIPVAIPVIDEVTGSWNGEYEDGYLIDFDCLGDVVNVQVEKEEVA